MSSPVLFKSTYAILFTATFLFFKSMFKERVSNKLIVQGLSGHICLIHNFSCIYLLKTSVSRQVSEFMSVVTALNVKINQVVLNP